MSVGGKSAALVPLLCEARLNDSDDSSFTPQPAAQANRRPADFFE